PAPRFHLSPCCCVLSTCPKNETSHSRQRTAACCAPSWTRAHTCWRYRRIGSGAPNGNVRPNCCLTKPTLAPSARRWNWRYSMTPSWTCRKSRRNERGTWTRTTWSSNAPRQADHPRLVERPERRMIATDTLVVQNNRRRVICFVCISHQQIGQIVENEPLFVIVDRGDHMIKIVASIVHGHEPNVVCGESG